DLPADAVVALPEPVPAPIDGLPRDEQGFLPIDDRCRVTGAERIYGAGDVTSSRLKQGGVAAQQADASARAIVADLGLGPEPGPFRPVLRGLMLAGPVPRYRRVDPGRGAEPEGGETIPWPR